MIDTAPYVEQKEPKKPILNVQNFNMELINSTNEKLLICSTCENCIEKNGRPHCSAYDIPISGAVNKTECIIGKW